MHVVVRPTQKVRKGRPPTPPETLVTVAKLAAITPSNESLTLVLQVLYGWNVQPATVARYVSKARADGYDMPSARERNAYRRRLEAALRKERAAEEAFKDARAAFVGDDVTTDPQMLRLAVAVIRARVEEILTELNAAKVDDLTNAEDRRELSEELVAADELERRASVIEEPMQARKARDDFVKVLHRARRRSLKSLEIELGTDEYQLITNPSAALAPAAVGRQWWAIEFWALNVGPKTLRDLRPYDQPPRTDALGTDHRRYDDDLGTERDSHRRPSGFGPDC
jgi:hypothetical protein